MSSSSQARTSELYSDADGPQDSREPSRDPAGRIPENGAPEIEVSSLAGVLQDYVSIARPDNWFKNVFVLPGMLLVPFFFSVEPSATLFGNLFLAIIATCLVASSNYVINEVLDAPSDRFHPVKRNRPVAAGRISLPLAYMEWLILGAVGISLAFLVNIEVGLACAGLWIMGVVYNIPPIRTKELAYLDVLSEAVNNPLRMTIGWYAMGVAVVPPVSALFAYWMFGSFLMAIKRFAEYRRIDNPERAAEYRSSFARYTEESLMASCVFYLVMMMMGTMAFVMLYRIELVFVMPILAYLIAFYTFLGFQDDSPVQYPERLYRVSHLRMTVIVGMLACVSLLFAIDAPWFEGLFTLLTPQY